MVTIRPMALTLPALTVMLVALSTGCKEDGSTLAGYTDVPSRLSKIIVQDSTFTPKVTWVGGYTSAFGINLGTSAALDSTLVWLVYQAQNALQYPVQVGHLPHGAQDLSSNYKGTPANRLIEDSTYTYWVMKEDAWSQVSKLAGSGRKVLVVDTMGTTLVQTRNDTVIVNSSSFISSTRRTDVFINISDFKAFGRLAELTVTETDSSNDLIIRWQVRTAGTDSLISAIGVVKGQEYSVSGVVWEMISSVQGPDTTYYWINNVISSPIKTGAHVPNTETFTEYPVGGIQRGSPYLVWIANKDWDREGRIRSTPNYAYATFYVW